MGWFTDHQAFVAWTFAASILTFIGTLIVLPILIVRMRADYFVKPPPPESWRRRHAVIRWTVIALKNMIGLLLVIAGLVMLFAPGQGLLAILIGLSLVNGPGKRWVELKLIQNRHVYRAINWIRAKYHRPPLLVPPRARDARPAPGS